MNKKNSSSVVTATVRLWDLFYIGRMSQTLSSEYFLAYQTTPMATGSVFPPYLLRQFCQRCINYCHGNSRANLQFEAVHFLFHRWSVTTGWLSSSCILFKGLYMFSNRDGQNYLWPLFVFIKKKLNILLAGHAYQLVDKSLWG